MDGSSFWVAPSLFLKAMIKIFELILDNALIYIDDIFLFSENHEAHQMAHFVDIIQQHGIMLSEQKSFLTQSSIDFLGLHIHDGVYQPGAHLTQELIKFFNENLSQKHIQQFLGIINYVRDFIHQVAHHTS